MNKRVSTGMAVVATVAALAAAGCGGGEEEAAEAASPSVGTAFLATNDRDRAAVDIDGDDGEDGVVEGVPSLREGDDTAPPPAAVGSARAACIGTTLVPGPDTMRDAVRATLCLLNAERGARGLAPLRANALLARAAVAHSRDMVERSYFGHNTPSGVDFVTRIKRAGYLRNAAGWTVGENLAWGAGDAARPRDIVDAWMASPGHRANILNRAFREIGVGIVAGAPFPADPGATYGTEFGTRFR